MGIRVIWILFLMVQPGCNNQLSLVIMASFLSQFPLRTKFTNNLSKFKQKDYYKAKVRAKARTKVIINLKYRVMITIWINVIRLNWVRLSCKDYSSTRCLISGITIIKLFWKDREAINSLHSVLIWIDGVTILCHRWNQKVISRLSTIWPILVLYRIFDCEFNLILKISWKICFYF